MFEKICAILFLELEKGELMTYRDFFARVKKEQHNFSMFNTLIRGMDSQNPQGWEDAQIEANILSNLWDIILESFMWWCVRMSIGNAECDKSYYEFATEVAETCRKILNVEFGINLATAAIISPCEMAAQKGIVSINEDIYGKRTVSLTEKGEIAAQEILTFIGKKD